ncbi:M23 family metallopeptidase [Gracilibacillus oryzae]|uniref:M23 family metallopeptidase n=1 Tax=Gracilibacillus oryzae TaxID=1672701 RepID=A0A7C8L758_9BACI|nr:M23 family metallopeptidase [Gracilibacillus oryzae]KAB8135779.1 M23 family metallopeptidase [Gracilibacillus oryzae]
MKQTVITPVNFAEQFFQKDFRLIYHQTAGPFQQLVTEEQFIDIGESFNEEVSGYILEIHTKLDKNLTHYLWLDTNRSKAISVTFDNEHTIHSIQLAPFQTHPETDKIYTKNEYIMPITDTWFVVWGGTNQFINYHYAYEAQRYAYDLVIKIDEQSYQGNPGNVKNYHAFGKDLIAPADGQVIMVINDKKDHQIGDTDENQPAGNCVVIAHDKNEYSMIAHMKQGSIIVNEGDVVKQGQMIGKCGNSGNTSEPHIHFQVMDHPNFLEGKSIRIRFNDHRDPVQGDYVSPVL